VEKKEIRGNELLPYHFQELKEGDQKENSRPSKEKTRTGMEPKDYVPFVAPRKVKRNGKLQNGVSMKKEGRGSERRRWKVDSTHQTRKGRAEGKKGWCRLSAHLEHPGEERLRKVPSAVGDVEKNSGGLDPKIFSSPV